MIKIIGRAISDIIRHPSGAVIAISGVDPNSPSTLSYFVFNVHTRTVDRVKSDTYLECKFGPEWPAVTLRLSDTVACSCAPLEDGGAFVIYTNGDTGVFDEFGTLSGTGRLLYRGEPAMGAAPQGNDVWCCVPRNNLIVRYNVARDLVVMRIGGTDQTSFGRPVDVSAEDGKLFVCAHGSRAIKTVDMTDYSVSDLYEFSEPVFRYIRSGGHEIVALASGVYML